MARKYDMATTPRRLLMEFGGLEALKTNPLEAFCTAYPCELGDAALIAATASLKTSTEYSGRYCG